MNYTELQKYNSLMSTLAPHEKTIIFMYAKDTPKKSILKIIREYIKDHEWQNEDLEKWNIVKFVEV